MNTIKNELVHFVTLTTIVVLHCAQLPYRRKTITNTIWQLRFGCRQASGTKEEQQGVKSPTVLNGCGGTDVKWPKYGLILLKPLDRLMAEKFGPMAKFFWHYICMPVIMAE